MPADSSQLVDRVELRVGDTYDLEVELETGDEIISQNRHDLSYYDPIEISRLDAITSWLAWATLLPFPPDRLPRRNPGLLGQSEKDNRNTGVCTKATGIENEVVQLGIAPVGLIVAL